MPIKDPRKRKEYARQQYLKARDVFIARSKARRLRLQAEKALTPREPKPLQPCTTCGAERGVVEFPKRGNKCKSCVRVYHKAYRTRNAEQIAASKKAWVTENKERKAEQDRLYAIQNPSKRKMARDKWSKLNPGKNTAAKTKNKLERVLRIPAWLTEDDHWMIEQAYELAALRTRLFGMQWHVDHIIPLKGKRVSGLHVPQNLQVIPAVVNLRKNNRWDHA